MLKINKTASLIVVFSKNMKKIIINFILVSMILIFTISMLVIFFMGNVIYHEKNEQENVSEIILNNPDWQYLYSINDDLYAIIQFEDNLIYQPVVQFKDNDKYINTSFFNENNSQGTIFLDAYYDNEDDVKIIYGHNVYYDAKAMFSPLEKLFKQENYEKYKFFKLIYQNDIEIYQIFACLEYDIYDNNFDYQIDKFKDEKMFNKWLTYILENNMILLEEQQYSIEDNYILLQTCKRWDEDKRLLIVAKKSEL